MNVPTDGPLTPLRAIAVFSLLLFATCVVGQAALTALAPGARAESVPTLTLLLSTPFIGAILLVGLFSSVALLLGREVRQSTARYATAPCPPTEPRAPLRPRSPEHEVALAKAGLLDEA